MLFLPQRPYLVLGSLREQLLYPSPDGKATNEELENVLSKVNLEGLAERFGGLDVVMDWARLLSPGEQQRLACARLLLAMPLYAVLDEATSALDVNNEARLYRHLQESGTTYISVGHRPTLLDYHDNVLELHGGGRWRLMDTDAFRTAPAA
jgi:putative ATP-binding cassette transporter